MGGSNQLSVLISQLPNRHGCRTKQLHERLPEYRSICIEFIVFDNLRRHLLILWMSFFRLPPVLLQYYRYCADGQVGGLPRHPRFPTKASLGTISIPAPLGHRAPGTPHFCLIAVSQHKSREAVFPGCIKSLDSIVIQFLVRRCGIHHPQSSPLPPKQVKVTSC